MKFNIFIFSALICLVSLATTVEATNHDNGNGFVQSSDNTFSGSALRDNTFDGSGTVDNTFNGSGMTNNTGITGCTGNGVCIQNPLRANSITEFFLQIIEILLIFAIPIIVLFIILAGFKFVTAQGNETTIGEAKRALLYAIIGGLLILGAFLILAVIQGTVASFQANP